MLKTIVVVMIGLLSTIYLLNPGAGVFEIIPDNIPGIGNLDEATALLLLIACFRYFGIDLSNLFRRKHKRTLEKN